MLLHGYKYYSASKSYTYTDILYTYLMKGLYFSKQSVWNKELYFTEQIDCTISQYILQDFRLTVFPSNDQLLIVYQGARKHYLLDWYAITQIKTKLQIF